MTKKKKIIIGLCILAVLLLAFIGGNAFAKYRTTANSQGVADIAKWVFNVNGNNTDSTFQTISLGSSCDEATLVNGKIAPGTQGAFYIDIDTTGSDVGVNYDVIFSSDINKPTNLKFIYEGQTYDTLQELNSMLTGTIDANNTDEYGNLSKVAELRFDWFWEYESGNDAIDTEEGIADYNYTFDVLVTGTQAVPQLP